MKTYPVKLYDKYRRPILPGDIVKLFHFIASGKHKRRYMYKLCLGIEELQDCTMYTFEHIGLKRGTYVEMVKPPHRLCKDMEVIQGYTCEGMPDNVSTDFYERKRLPKGPSK